MHYWEDREEKKAQDPERFQPTTSLFWGMRSTTLPPDIKKNLRCSHRTNYDLSIVVAWWCIHSIEKNESFFGLGFLRLGFVLPSNDLSDSDTKSKQKSVSETSSVDVGAELSADAEHPRPVFPLRRCCGDFPRADFSSRDDPSQAEFSDRQTEHNKVFSSRTRFLWRRMDT